ncbi:hypothetical protein [Hyphomicrobium sp. LHD-15]|uniref:hypothetical protein n=1 Tax=Hyphomicrobium sp. LHD-15 TaxID=3072142 RepID=UPI0028107F81|nr:hypothetical protein [Hyphomicrobium sp. LHD-15]MDQ8698491.1 hypothetical protein [Hyphomicrobium sp. LHD-15]
MNVSGYSANDIKLFRAILDASMAESLACGADIPLDLMTMRLFKAAGKGERDPRRLVAAVLGLDEKPAERSYTFSAGTFSAGA